MAEGQKILVVFIPYLSLFILANSCCFNFLLQFQKQRMKTCNKCLCHTQPDEPEVSSRVVSAFNRLESEKSIKVRVRKYQLNFLEEVLWPVGSLFLQRFITPAARRVSNRFNKTTTSPLIAHKAAQSGATRSAERLFFSSETLKRADKLTPGRTAVQSEAQVRLDKEAKRLRDRIRGHVIHVYSLNQQNQTYTTCEKHRKHRKTSFILNLNHFYFFTYLL